MLRHLVFRRTASLVAGSAVLLSCGAALPASKKGVRFWNLTSETLTEVSLAPAGTTTFGPSQCANDKDGSVDFDEQIAVTGVSPGVYDLRTRDDKGRVCYARSVKVPPDDVFSIGDKDLTDCAK
jgi:hypothetical protein